MMRVLFVTGEFPPMQGGVGDCTNEVAKALVTLGVETHVLTTALGNASTRQLSPGPAGHADECGVRVHRAMRRWTFGSIPVVVRVVRELAPAVVHIQYQTGAYAMRPAINFLPRALRTSPAAVVTTFHDLKVPYLFPKAGRVREWVTRLLARTSAAVIGTNGEDLRRLLTWGLNNVSLIPIGSNIPTAPPPGYVRAAWRARMGATQATILLSYFGFLNESKGAESLVRSLALIPEARLIMIGGQVGASDPTNAAYLARVRSLIEELGLTSRVTWTDYMPAAEVSANLLASDICVLPYRDGASYRRGSFMAALAHGLPIVTTRGGKEDEPEGGLPPMRDGENVMLVPPDDPRALAAAIRRVAATPGLRSELSEGAKKLAASFTWDRIAQQHLQLYERLVPFNPSSP